MARIYKAAIVGCGSIAGGYDENSHFQHVFTHAGAYRKHARFELAVVAERKKNRLLRFLKTWQVPKGYRNYRKMLKNERVDVLSVCVPDKGHYAVVRDALNYGTAKCILLEKPIAFTLREAEDLIELCKKSKTSLYVNYNRLWDPAHRAARKLISTRSIGAVQACVAYYVRGIRHNGTTMINSVRFLLGEEIGYAQALKAVPCAIKGDLAVDAVLTTDKGIQIVLIACDKGGYGHSIFEIDTMGNKGRLRLSDNGYKAELYRTREYRRYPGFRELFQVPPREAGNFPKSGLNRTLLHTLDDIAVSLDGNRLELRYAEEAVIDMRVAEALTRSIKSGGRRIKI